MSSEDRTIQIKSLHVIVHFGGEKWDRADNTERSVQLEDGMKWDGAGSIHKNELQFKLTQSYIFVIVTCSFP